MQTSPHRLIATYRASRVSFTWLGTRKALDAGQRDEVAGTFGAEGHFLSAGKKLLDTKHSAYRTLQRGREDGSRFRKRRLSPSFHSTDSNDGWYSLGDVLVTGTELDIALSSGDGQAPTYVGGWELIRVSNVATVTPRRWWSRPV